MTKKDFARELGMSPQMLGCIERGEATLEARVLVLAARVAGQPVSAILGEMPLYDRLLPELRQRVAELEGNKRQQSKKLSTA